MLFHSTTEELLRYQDELPFIVLADPGKDLYRRFGVESGRRALLDRRAWGALLSGQAASVRTSVTKRRSPAPSRPNGDNLGLPADMLITPMARVAAVKYGEHAYAQWTVD